MNRRPVDKVRLRGARLALVNEVGHNDTFNDQRVKEIASREAISARMLYGYAFDYFPSQKLWVRGNHRPAILDSGDGMWRRVILWLLQRQFSPDERVSDRLREEARLSVQRFYYFRLLPKLCVRIGMNPKSQPAFVRMMGTKWYRRKTSNGKAYLEGIDVNLGEL